MTKIIFSSGLAAPIDSFLPIYIESGVSGLIHTSRCWNKKIFSCKVMAYGREEKAVDSAAPAAHVENLMDSRLSTGFPQSLGKLVHDTLFPHKRKLLKGQFPTGAWKTWAASHITPKTKSETGPKFPTLSTAMAATGYKNLIS